MRSPVVQQLLDRLAAIAARTTGLEDSVWIGVVPLPESQQGFDITVPADGARAVAVCTPDRVQSVLAAAPSDSGPAIPRLRVMGTVGAGDLSLTEPLRAEVRKAGPGGPYSTAVVASLFGSDGTMLTSERLATTNPLRLGRFSALLPVGDLATGVASLRFRVDPNLFALELRATPQMVLASTSKATAARVPRYFEMLDRSPSPPRGGPQLPFFERPGGTPSVEILSLTPATASDPAMLQWRYTHTAAISPRFEIEVGRVLPDGTTAYSRIARPRDWADRLSLPGFVQPPAAARAAVQSFVRVVASDGWNVATDQQAIDLQTQVIIRHGGGGSFWADVAPSLDVRELRWSVAGRTEEVVEADRLFAVSPSDIGQTLQVRAPGLEVGGALVIPNWRRRW